MPYGLDTHVLTVDANVIHKVDTGNLENLFSMWTVFSKCADSVEQGRRLENLSWRLWQREQFCCDAEKPATTITPTPSSSASSSSSSPREIPDNRIQDEVPQLSGSVDSVVEDEAVEFSSISSPLDITRPIIRRQDSSASTRSRRDRHITADDFEKMVVSIIHTKEPLSAPLPTPQFSPRPEDASTTAPAAVAPVAASATVVDSSSSTSSNTEYSSLDTSSPHITPQTQIVHGFSPSPVAVCLATPAPPAATVMATIPEPGAAPAAKLVQPKKPAATFALGGSCSSSEPEDSVRNPMFRVGPSSGSRSSSLITAQRKQASFANQIAALRTYDASEEAAVEDSDTDDDVDESAIEDDESSDWEDSIEESGKSSIDEAVFKRDNSKVALTSRPSLITLMIEKNDRTRALASQSTPALRRQQQRSPPTATAAPAASSPNDSDEGGLVMKRAAGRQSLLKPINEGAARTKAQPIVAPAQHEFAHAAMSPRTTRMKMLHTELTASLRMGLFRERQQRSATINAVLKRRHTSHDVANLKQYPEKHCMKQEEDLNSANFNFIIKDTFNGYHDKGW